LARRIWSGLLLLVIVAGCRTGRDYAATDAPRYYGAPADTATRHCARPCEILVASFNIEFAKRIDGAIELLASDSALRRADILLLQEMDAQGAKRIASALGTWHIYYPAIYHKRSRRDFGNAVLSRFPIIADAKLVLPCPSRYAGTHRVATAATIRIGQSAVRVYSTHLGTPADISSRRRRDQMRAIISDADKYRTVIIGGDMNDAGIGLVAERSGYAWPTRYGPRTTRFGRWDHILLKGFKGPSGNASGTVVRSGGVSDHHPVWASGILGDS
jgi:endonuclease/exonuclease/phosphatase family metal-dependent hydrolase